jgi:N-methylhydantoinase A
MSSPITDVSLVAGGRAQVASDRRLAGQRLALQALDIVSVGAGGGSLARVDAGGVLHVGPESAGADPGPACYGKGGEEATVTDANLVLGFLDPDNFLGGRERLDRAAADAAVDRVGHAMGIGRLGAAEGIHRIVNTRMAEGIRLVSVRRGVDPRRFALLAFGGAAALHVTDVARQLELSRVVVPRLASVLSAWGMLTSDLRYEIARTHIGDASALDADALRAVYAEMEEEGRRRLAQAAFDGEVVVHRSAEMRYGEQIFEVGVDLDDIDWHSPDLVALLAAAFHSRHEELYTYALPDQEAVLDNARVAVIGRLPALPRVPARAASAPAAPLGSRRIYLGGWHEAPVYDVDALRPGQMIDGPAIVESATTTTLLRPGDRARSTELGWLDVAIAR